MLTSIRSLMAATLLVGTAFVAAPAMAQDSSGISVTGNAAIVTEYRFRGVDLSGGDIAIQGGIDLSHDSGFYLGTWGSSLDEDTVGYGHTELDVYGGWTGNLTEAVAADVGVLMYLYPNAGPGDFDYVEFYGSLSTTLGPVGGTLGVAYAPEQDSLGGTDNFYVYTDLSAGIPNTPLSLTAHLGYTDGFLTYTDDSKAFDWSVGAAYAITDKLSVGVSYIGVEGDRLPTRYDFTDDAVVGTLSASF
ncbi:conserved hypothetical protein [Altererythrobacter sp. B11]|nr:TorF family putative porin [Altererythrobacter sp. B11]BBC74231.1 conserved hypothetical protein [Altererythrobacter sp. B11]